MGRDFTDWFGFDTENDDKGRITLTALVSEKGDVWVWEKQGGFKEFCDKVLCRDRNIVPVVICHNLEYDLINEFGRFMEGVTVNYLKGKLIWASYGNVTFYDSGNHFKMPLKDIGKAIGITKLDFDINSKEYVSTDSLICLTAMTRARDYIAKLGGQIGVTSGSSSVSVWKAMTDGRFLTGPYDNDFYRSGYYGGRTEIFHMREEGLVEGFDINSMYPYCMLNEFPDMDHIMWGDFKLKGEKGMATVTLNIPKDLFVAPLVTRTCDRLLYPVGHVTGTWTYDEIRFAESVGAKVLKIHDACGTNRTVRPFDQFINTLYLKRKDSKDESERLFLKVVMNSLYGKLASKNEVENTITYHNAMKKYPDRIDDIKWVVPFRFGLMKSVRKSSSKYVNVLWGAMVTAYSRILLTQYLNQVPSDSLLYCDTDSIYVRNGFKFKTSNELGGLKLEKSKEGWYSPLPKVYRHGDFYRAKGIPRARKITDARGEEVYVDFAQEFIENGQTTFLTPLRFKQSLNSRMGVANQWLPKTVHRKKKYDNKRIMHDVCYPPIFLEQMNLPLD